jgi:hypothetical protein
MQSNSRQAEEVEQEAAMVADVGVVAREGIPKARDGIIMSTVSTLPTRTEISPALNGKPWDPMVAPQ